MVAPRSASNGVKSPRGHHPDFPARFQAGELAVSADDHGHALLVELTGFLRDD